MCGDKPEKSTPVYLWGGAEGEWMKGLRDKTFNLLQPQLGDIFGEPGEAGRGIDAALQQSLHGINVAEKGAMGRARQMATGRGLTGGAAMQTELAAAAPYAGARGETIWSHEKERVGAEQKRVAMGIHMLRNLLAESGTIATGATQGMGSKLLSLVG